MASNELVVDASVATKWFLRDEALLAQADMLLADWVNGRWIFIAPGHFPYEVTGAILRAVRMHRLLSSDAESAIAYFTQMVRNFAFVAPELVVDRAAQLVDTLGVNFFDACYLQTARVRGVQLITADEAFYRQTSAQPEVLWLGDHGYPRAKK